MKSTRGFTLLEVMVALAILTIFLVPLMGSVSIGLRSVNRSRYLATAMRLAEDKLTDVQMTIIPDTQGTEEGEFTDFPGYRWQVEMIKTPMLELMETQFSGLKAMEVHVRVYWTEAGIEQYFELETLLLE